MYNCETFHSFFLILTCFKFVDTSEWPPGPYALLSPNTGCPESGAQGWRRGYLSVTWVQPHNITSFPYCDRTIGNMKPDINYITSASNQTEKYTCPRALLSDELNGHVQGISSDYEWRLNFCFKIKDDSASNSMWPVGNYSIFGVGKDCPLGM